MVKNSKRYKKSGKLSGNLHYIQFDGRLTVTLVGLTTQLTRQLIIMY